MKWGYLGERLFKALTPLIMNWYHFLGEGRIHTQAASRYKAVVEKQNQAWPQKYLPHIIFSAAMLSLELQLLQVIETLGAHPVILAWPSPIDVPYLQ